MTMKQVIVFPRGQLTDRDKARLEENDIIAIEADDPLSIVMLVPAVDLVRAGDLFMSALHAVNVGSEAGSFVAELYRRIKDREQKSLN